MKRSPKKKKQAEQSSSKLVTKEGVQTKYGTLDWSVFLLTIWLTSRFFWTCDPSGFAFDYLWGLLGVLGAGILFWFRKESFGRITCADILVALFFCLYIVACLLGFVHGDKRAVLNCIWSASFWVLVYTMVRLIVTTSDRMRIVIMGFLCTSVILSTWSIYQRFVEYPQEKAAYELNPEVVLQRVGIDPAEDSPARRSFEDRFFAFEPTACFSLTNSLAVFLTPWLVLLGCDMMESLTNIKNRLIISTINPIIAPSYSPFTSRFLLFFLLVFALFLTHSRAAMLGVGTALLLYLMYKIILSSFSRIRKFIVTLFVVLSPIVVLIAIGLWRPSVFDSAILTLEYRFEYWETSIEIIACHPWFGIGAGNFQNFYSMFMPPTAGESVSDPHNFLLEIATVAGIPAALVLWSLLGLLGYRVTQKPDCECHSNSFDGFSWLCPQTYSSLKSGCIVTLTSTIIGYALGFVAMEQLPGPFFLLFITAFIAVFVIIPIFNRVTITPFLLSLMLLSLLLALTLSGGIGFTSIAVVFWTLCALIVNQTQKKITNEQKDTTEPSVRRFNIKSRLVTGGLMLLFVLCFYTGFNPTTRSAQAKNSSLNVQTMEEQLSFLEQATIADPISFQVHFDLAQWNWIQWERTKDKSYFDSCVTAFSEAITRNPMSGVLWREYGIRLYKYGRQTGDYSHELDASDALERACDIHRADYIAKAYLALQRMTTPILSEASKEIYQATLSAPLTSAEMTDTLSKLLLKNQHENARKWGEELIHFSDSNPHQNRKIPVTLKAELEKEINRK